MFKKLFLGVALVGVLLAIQPKDALACSGYPYFGVEDLPTMDLLVHATVIETDDSGHNAILRVENYYKGKGPLFLTVMRYSPALTSGALVRGYDTGCLYAGQGRNWIHGSEGYFGLLSNGDGTYTDYNGGTAHFYAVDGVITYQEGYTEGYALEFDDPLDITEEAFIQEMLKAGGIETPVPPNNSEPTFYPLKRFLNITTENGTRYQINPDRSVTELPEDAPLAISPDGAHVAFRAEDDSIAFQYIWTTNQLKDDYPDDDEMFQKLIVKGQAIRFSNDSSFAAVWDHDHLTIYMLANYGENELYGYGNGLNLIELTQVEIAASQALPKVLWSADSTTLVWEDSTGFWHWDIYDRAEPQQLAIEADDAQLLDVSMYGRYVRIGKPETWMLVDAETLETYDNAVAAPTEQFLIFTSTPSEIETPCTPPLRETCTVHLEDNNLQNPFIYRGNLIGFAMCSSADEGCEVNSYSWHPAIGRTGYMGGRYIRDYISQLRQIVYDPQYQQAALRVGDYKVYFDFYSDFYFEEERYLPYLDVLDLESELDSPIAQIEWGQPIFYEDYFLSTSTYLPPSH